MQQKTWRRHLRGRKTRWGESIAAARLLVGLDPEDPSPDFLPPKPHKWDAIFAARTAALRAMGLPDAGDAAINWMDEFLGPRVLEACAQSRVTTSIRRRKTEEEDAVERTLYAAPRTDATGRDEWPDAREPASLNTLWYSVETPAYPGKSPEWVSAGYAADVRRGHQLQESTPNAGQRFRIEGPVGLFTANSLAWHIDDIRAQRKWLNEQLGSDALDRALHASKVDAAARKSEKDERADRYRAEIASGREPKEALYAVLGWVWHTRSDYADFAKNYWETTTRPQREKWHRDRQKSIVTSVRASLRAARIPDPPRLPTRRGERWAPEPPRPSRNSLST